MIYAFAAQGITTVLAFVTRTVMVNTIGIEAISINGLFTEVIQALSLAELGIGGAIVYSLYQPLAQKNVKKICQLMTLFQTVYRVIAMVTLGLGLALCPFIQYIVTDIGYSVYYIREIYILFVLQISSSYLFTYKTSLLNADQNMHMYSLIATLVKVIGTLLMIAALLVTNKYIVYLIANIMSTVLTNVAISMYVDKKYTFLKFDNTLPKEERRIIFGNVKNIFVKQLSGKITNSTDNILISVLVSTIYVGYYSFYAVILSTFKSLIDKVDESIYASMGNLYVTESNERCLSVLSRLTWIYGNIAVFSGVCIFNCMDPFISGWVGNEYLLPESVLIVLCINLFLYISCKPIYQAMHLSGFFKEGRNISIIGSTVNLITSVILGMKLGMLGIFIGTFMTYFIQIVLKIKDVFQMRFKISCRNYVCMWGTMFGTLVVGMFLSKEISQQFIISNYWLEFFKNGCISAMVSTGLIILFSFKREEFRYSLDLAKKMVTRKKI